MRWAFIAGGVVVAAWAAPQLSAGRLDLDLLEWFFWRVVYALGGALLLVAASLGVAEIKHRDKAENADSPLSKYDVLKRLGAGSFGERVCMCVSSFGPQRSSGGQPFGRRDALLLVAPTAHLALARFGVHLVVQGRSIWRCCAKRATPTSSPTTRRTPC